MCDDAQPRLCPWYKWRAKSIRVWQYTCRTSGHIEVFLASVSVILSLCMQATNFLFALLFLIPMNVLTHSLLCSLSRYPWGSNNNQSLYPVQTTGTVYHGPQHVGKFGPDALSPFGVGDLVGGVWEYVLFCSLLFCCMHQLCECGSLRGSLRVHIYGAVVPWIQYTPPVVG